MSKVKTFGMVSYKNNIIIYWFSFLKVFTSLNKYITAITMKTKYNKNELTKLCILNNIDINNIAIGYTRYELEIKQLGSVDTRNILYDEINYIDIDNNNVTANEIEYNDICKHLDRDDMVIGVSEIGNIEILKVKSDNKYIMNDVGQFLLINKHQ